MLILYNCHLPVESFDIVGLKGLKAICGDISLVVLWHWKQWGLNAAFM